MKKLPLALIGLFLGISVSTAHAQEYMFTYSKLYSQIKNNNKEGHDDVKVGVFFVDADTKKICTIDKAWMEKEEHYEEFVIPSSNELPIPFDMNLKSANPLVFVQTEESVQCDYSLVVMTKKPLYDRVNYEQVEKLIPQMQVMLEDLGGMFASWFTPEVQGLTLEFSNNINGHINVSNGKVIPIENGKAAITLNDIPQDGYLTLPQETLRVLPYLPSATQE